MDTPTGVPHFKFTSGSVSPTELGQRPSEVKDHLMKSISSDGSLAPPREAPTGVLHFMLLTSGSISSTELGCQLSQFNNQLMKNTSDDVNSAIHRETPIYVPHYKVFTSGSVSSTELGRCSTGFNDHFMKSTFCRQKFGSTEGKRPQS